MHILKNWDEIGKAVNGLKAENLPTHNDPAKCWDFWNIRELLLRNEVPQDACIVDMGCGASAYGAVTLELLRAMGYKNLTGIDLYVPLYARVWAAIRGWFKFRELFPYRIMVGDITSTKLANNSVDVAILLSVVEHGVDLEKLFCELARVLKIGAVVYLSTDYWAEKIEIDKKLVASGARDNEPLPWQIFDQVSLNSLINVARKYRFQLKQNGTPSSCEDKPVYWQGVNYTFVAVEFEKLGPI